jgi:DNA replication protein DnaC
MTVAQNLDLLSKLKLPGLLAGYDQQRALPDIHTLSFDDRLTLMLEYEDHQRTAAQTTRRLQRAKLKYRDAAPETLIFQNRPGLDQALILKLCECDWVTQHLSLLIVGPTGSGKSFLVSRGGQSVPLITPQSVPARGGVRNVERVG